MIKLGIYQYWFYRESFGQRQKYTEQRVQDHKQENGKDQINNEVIDASQLKTQKFSAKDLFTLPKRSLGNQRLYADSAAYQKIQNSNMSSKLSGFSDISANQNQRSINSLNIKNQKPQDTKMDEDPKNEAYKDQRDYQSTFNDHKDFQQSQKDTIVSSITKQFQKMRLRHDQLQQDNSPSLPLLDRDTYIQKLLAFHQNQDMQSLDQLSLGILLSQSPYYLSSLDEAQNLKLRSLSMMILMTQNFKQYQSFALQILTSQINLSDKNSASQFILNEIIDFMIDHLESLQMMMQLQQKFSLKNLLLGLQKKGIYQSSQRIFMMSYILLTLTQSLCLTLPQERIMDKVATLYNQIALKIISGMILEGKESNNYEILATIVVRDLSEVCFSESLEFPVGSMLIKSFTLLLIQCVQIDKSMREDDEESKYSELQLGKIMNKIDLNQKIQYAELLSIIMIESQRIISEKEQSKQRICIC